MQSKLKNSPIKDLLKDDYPTSRWEINAVVGALPKINKKVAKYHATKGRTKL